VRVYVEDQALAQEPTVVLRSPDLNADGAVDVLDRSRWVLGGECTDLNWDGVQGDLADRAIFSAHWLHTSGPVIVPNVPNRSE
jgi:hypothetical protein